MRKLIIALVLLSIKMISQTTNPAPYCLSSYTSTSLYPEISKVELIGTGGFTNTSSKTPAPGYMYYDNVTAILFSGYQYTLNITLKNVDMETMLKVWADYNNDNIFGSSELIFSVPQGSVGMGMAVVKQTTITVPNINCQCNSRMRVSLGWHYANWGNSTFRLDSCNTAITGDGSSGETEDYKVFIGLPVGMKENISKNDLNLFPNPASDKIQFSSLQGENEVNVIEIVSGRNLLNAFLSDEKKEVDISNLPAGIYFVQMRSELGQTRQTKLIKE